MSGYIVFVRDERFEVYADSTLEAQVVALRLYQKKHPRAKVRSHEANAVLAERNGKPHVHIAVD